MDWQTLETRLVDVASAFLDDVLAKSRHPLYAAAFHSSYREEAGVIDLPSFAANTLEALRADHPEDWEKPGFWTVKWRPVDWRWDDTLTDDDALQALNDALNKAAIATKTRAQWQAVEQRFLQTVTAAARQVHERFARHPKVRDDFVVIFSDDDGGAELAGASMSPELFKHHFPEQAEAAALRTRLAGLPLAEQAAYYAGRLDSDDSETIDGEEAERWLIAHGEAAAPLMITRLADPEKAWDAALVLGLSGCASDEVLAALRKAMLDTAYPEDARNWAASALGHLRDHDWLLSQADDAALLPFVIQGCTAPFSGFRDRAAQPAPLDYRPLERLLQSHPAALKPVGEAMKPGTGTCEITPGEVAEALRGLQSPHAPVRWHAAIVLGEPYLGDDAIALARPALKAASLKDTNGKVAKMAKASLARLEQG
ncbi:DUF4303 domain-containing protein [Achromobacter sp. GG226]|uniref:DUF4303 domain-containing protein n=1 Tax=Verticiella alkaliphila TaxID=2779529 RepID=UPI001C0E522C|nr:DUF4303 domain-containing protein [Verticiella sp. GG226]MBU4612363.1 DUF4303 domain-containing protein [Verticiella sp. GG226]